MDKARKWKASREQASQMVTPGQEPGAGAIAVEESPGRGTKEKGVCFNCGKEGHFAQSNKYPSRGRKWVNMVIMLVVAKGEGTLSLETMHHPTTGRQTAASW